MTVACSTMIVNSLININERAIGSSLTATEGVYYLAKLNSFLESIALERLMIPAVVEESFSLSSGVGSYTIGVGGTFNTERPAKILNAYIRDSSSSDTGVTIIPFDRWAAVINKNVSGSYPEWLYYDQAYSAAGLGTVNVYPRPGTGLSLRLQSQKSLQSFSALSTSLTLPPGYQRFIESNFAIECAPGYASISPELMKIAKESKAAIKGINLPDTIMSLDAGIVRRHSGNILTGP